MSDATTTEGKQYIDELEEQEDFSSEVWKDIPGFEGLFMCSNFGRIKSIRRIINNREYGGIIRALQKDSNGYYRVGLWDKNEKRYKTFSVSRLVATLFVDNPNPIDFNVVNHKDANPLNNHFSNLEWVTQLKNVNEKHCKDIKKIRTLQKWHIGLEEIQFIQNNYSPGDKINGALPMSRKFHISKPAIKKIASGCYSDIFCESNSAAVNIGELRACPFCGATAKITKNQRTKRTLCRCTNTECLAMMSIAGTHNDEEYLKKMWNRRVYT